MPSIKTFLRVENNTNTDFRIIVSGIESYDWDGISRPDNNFHNRDIKAHSSSIQREEINTNANGKWVELTFSFVNGYEASIRFCQHYAFTKCPHVTSFELHNGKFEISYQREAPETMVIKVGDDQQLQNLIKETKQDAESKLNSAREQFLQLSNDININLQNNTKASFDQDAHKFDNNIQKIESVLLNLKQAAEQLTKANENFKDANQTLYNNKINDITNKEQEVTNLKQALINIKTGYQVFDQNPEQAISHFKEATKQLAGKHEYQSTIQNLNQQIKEINNMKQQIDAMNRKMESLQQGVNQIKLNTNEILKKSDQAIAEQRQSSFKIIKTIQDTHKEQTQALNSQATQLKQQIAGAEQQIGRSVGNAQSELQSNMDALKQELYKTEASILRNQNELHQKQSAEIRKQSEVIIKNIDENKKILRDARESIQNNLNKAKEDLKNHTSTVSKSEKADLRAQISSLSNQLYKESENIQKLTKQGINETIAVNQNLTYKLQKAEEHRKAIEQRAQQDRDKKFNDQINIAQENVKALTATLQKQNEFLEKQHQELLAITFEQTKVITWDIQSLNSQMKHGFLDAKGDRASKLQMLWDKLVEAENQRETIKQQLGNKIDANTDTILQDYIQQSKTLRADIEKVYSTTQDLLKEGFKTREKNIVQTQGCKLHEVLTVVNNSNQLIKEILSNKLNNKDSIVTNLNKADEALRLISSLPQNRTTKNNELASIKQIIKNLQENLLAVETKALQNQKEFAELQIDLARQDYVSKLDILLKSQNKFDQEASKKIIEQLQALKDHPIKLLNEAFIAEDQDADMASEMFAKAVVEFQAVTKIDSTYEKYLQVTQNIIDGNQLFNEGINLQNHTFVNKTIGGYKDVLDKFSTVKQKFQEACEFALHLPEIKHITENLQSNIKVVEHSEESIATAYNDAQQKIQQGQIELQKGHYQKALAVFQEVKNSLPIFMNFLGFDELQNNLTTQMQEAETVLVGQNPDSTTFFGGEYFSRGA